MYLNKYQCKSIIYNDNKFSIANLSENWTDYSLLGERLRAVAEGMSNLTYDLSEKIEKKRNNKGCRMSIVLLTSGVRDIKKKQKKKLYCHLIHRC